MKGIMRLPLFRILFGLGGVLLLGMLCGAGYLTFSFFRSYQVTKSELASSTSRIETLEQNLQDTTDALQNEQENNDRFRSQILQISSTVGTLEKRVITDPELLQKYSKVYFLNENYVPKSLDPIDPPYLYNASSSLMILTQVRPFLENMLDAAAADGVQLEVISAYRSFGSQASLKSSYLLTFGSGANTFSADQGYSEHQLGSTVDLTTPGVDATFTGFEKSKAYAWLEANAYMYGFELSYPKNNGYYQFEPWHWRFVGIQLATYLHDDNKQFYQMDQREITPYLAVLFNPSKQ